MFAQRNLTPSQRIDRAMATIMRTPQLAAYVAALTLGEVRADASVPTAYVDGRNMGISPAFIEFCTDGELVFVILHEATHLLLMDMLVMQKQWKIDAQLANAACDYANNYELRKLCAELPPNIIAFPVHKSGPKAGQDYGLFDQKYAGMSAPHIFELLREKVEDEQGDGPGDDEGDGEGNSGDWPMPSDEREDREDRETDSKNFSDDDEGDATDSKSDSKQGDRGNSEQQSPTRQHIEDNSWDKHDFDKVADMPADEKSKLTEDVKQAIAQGEILAGRAGGKSPRSHGAMLSREVPWHEIFRDFVKSNMGAGDDLTTWRQYKRSMIGQDIYLPSTYSERMRRMVVARDTSGSIGDQVLNLFNGYLVSVCQEIRPDEVIVLDWGSAVVNDERYNSLEGYDSIMHRTKVVGGGGTSPEVIGAYLKKHNIEADCLVVLTDGCFCSYNFADFGIPTLWCVLEYYWGGFTRPFGQAVKIKV